MRGLLLMFILGSSVVPAIFAQKSESADEAIFRSQEEAKVFLVKQSEYASLEKLVLDKTSKSGIHMVLVPAGKAKLGVQENDPYIKKPDIEEFETKLGFYIGSAEITQDIFAQLMGFNPSEFFDNPKLPVERTTWFECVVFCNKLSVKEGIAPYYGIENLTRDSQGRIVGAELSRLGGTGYRLPTRAEWEYACRAGTSTVYHFGNRWDPKYGNVEQDETTGKTKVAKSFSPNPIGLYDMYGNVSEWVDSGDEQDGVKDVCDLRKFIVNCAFYYEAESCRTYIFNPNYPGSCPGPCTGFRVVRNAK